MSAFTDFFKNLWTNIIKPDAIKAEQAGEAFFKAAATDAAQQLGVLGLQIITDGVTSAEETGGSGADKLAAAKAKITADLAAAAIAVPEHIVNVSIEAAVSQVNATPAATAAVAATAQANTTEGETATGK